MPEENSLPSSQRQQVRGSPAPKRVETGGICVNRIYAIFWTTYYTKCPSDNLHNGEDWIQKIRILIKQYSYVNTVDLQAVLINLESLLCILFLLGFFYGTKVSTY